LLVEKIGQTNLREREAKWVAAGTKMGISSDIHRISEYEQTNTSPTSLFSRQGDLALFGLIEPQPLLNRAEESDPN
jgi:hypothetical protein